MAAASADDQQAASSISDATDKSETGSAAIQPTLKDVYCFKVGVQCVACEKCHT